MPNIQIHKVFACLMIALLLPIAAAGQGLAFRERLPQYGLQEIKFQIPTGAPNPYDYDQITVDALLTSPSGKSIRIPAFYAEAWNPLQNFPERAVGWFVRFSPTEAGTYKGSIFVSMRGATPTPLAELSFMVDASAPPDRLRREGNRLVDKNGEPVFLYGANLCWGDVRDLAGYLELLKEAARHNVNCIRLWLAPWWLPIEGQLGRYDQNACARLERIMSEVESLGLNVILCIEQHGNFLPEGDWPRHPYNSINGGPCDNPIDFFSDETAKKHFKNRLRYIIARWGHSPSLLSLELFNEVELVPLEQGFADSQEVIAAWHREMSQYIRSIDPYLNLISTSSDIPLQRQLASEGAIDLIQLHLYRNEDLNSFIEGIVSSVVAESPVPVILSEFGNAVAVSEEVVSPGILAAHKAGASGAFPWLQNVPTPLPHLRQIMSARKSLEDAHDQQTPAARP